MRPLLAGAAALYAVVIVPVLLVGTVLMSAQSTAIGAAAAAVDCSVDEIRSHDSGATRQVGNDTYTGEQLANAQTIITVAARRALPRRAAVLGVATALVESDLHNLSYGDRDSLGLFQQRPSQGWGSRAQILNPVYATNTFYDHLIAVPGWASMPPGMAEQQVQRSGFPGSYAPREPTAAALTDTYWHGPDNPAPPPGTAPGTAPGNSPGTKPGTPPGTPSGHQVGFAAGGCPDTRGGNRGRGGTPDPTTLPRDVTLPTDPTLRAAIGYALAQLGKPYVWGAEGPDSFDCSGLMQAAWAHAGVAISRTTATQVHDGIAVGSLAQLQPGDMLFIPGADGTPQHPGHVGMFVGGDHTSNHPDERRGGYVVEAYDTQRGVILTTMDTWAPKVVAIRRIVAGATAQSMPVTGTRP